LKNDVNFASRYGTIYVIKSYHFLIRKKEIKLTLLVPCA
jgi:hypothetical protein